MSVKIKSIAVGERDRKEGDRRPGNECIAGALRKAIGC